MKRTSAKGRSYAILRTLTGTGHHIIDGTEAGSIGYAIGQYETNRFADANGTMSGEIDLLLAELDGRASTSF